MARSAPVPPDSPSPKGLSVVPEGRFPMILKACPSYAGTGLQDDGSARAGLPGWCAGRLSGWPPPVRRCAVRAGGAPRPRRRGRACRAPRYRASRSAPRPRPSPPARPPRADCGAPGCPRAGRAARQGAVLAATAGPAPAAASRRPRPGRARGLWPLPEDRCGIRRSARTRPGCRGPCTPESRRRRAPRCHGARCAATPQARRRVARRSSGPGPAAGQAARPAG